ncbi:MAG: hypothetical protein AAF570_24795, partial [Bacteroidota bacterium]
MFKKTAIFLLLVTVITVSACKKDKNGLEFGIFTVQADATTAVADGVIGSSSLDDFNEMLDSYPNINVIEMRNMPGSMDDETNVQLGRALYAAEINTHLGDGGSINSGAVDLFLAGRTRTRGSNIEVGVHSWASGNQEATDFPESSSEHDLFINYYIDIGFSEQDARDFYFF